MRLCSQLCIAYRFYCLRYGTPLRDCAFNAVIANYVLAQQHSKRTRVSVAEERRDGAVTKGAPEGDSSSGTSDEPANAEGAGEGEEWDYPEWEDLEAFDLFRELHLPRPAEGSDAASLNESRVRGAYHRHVTKYHPQYGTAFESEAELEQRLRRITVSYLTLKNSALSKIYVQHGWDGLRRSESYSERSVFEECPYEVYDRFFDGSNPDDREYLLLNGNAHLSEEDEEEEECTSVAEPDRDEDAEDDDGDDKGAQSDGDEEIVLPPAALVASRALPKSEVAQLPAPTLPRMALGGSAGVGVQAFLAQQTGAVGDASRVKDGAMRKAQQVAAKAAGGDNSVSAAAACAAVSRVAKRGPQGVPGPHPKRTRVSVAEERRDGAVSPSGSAGVNQFRTTGIGKTHMPTPPAATDISCHTVNLLLLHNFFVSIGLTKSAAGLQLEAQLDERARHLMFRFFMDRLQPPPVARSDDSLQLVSASQVIKMYRFTLSTNK